mmetsp:Transcript_44859/g.116611  ORF Transcript_44859/g.116611 Transcript_44859/m.116611 type:complete len:207 (+) Transcript_44859:362-982(+)
MCRGTRRQRPPPRSPGGAPGHHLALPWHWLRGARGRGDRGRPPARVQGGEEAAAHGLQGVHGRGVQRRGPQSHRALPLLRQPLRVPRGGLLAELLVPGDDLQHDHGRGHERARREDRGRHNSARRRCRDVQDEPQRHLHRQRLLCRVAGRGGEAWPLQSQHDAEGHQALGIGQEHQALRDSGRLYRGGDQGEGRGDVRGLQHHPQR